MSDGIAPCVLHISQVSNHACLKTTLRVDDRRAAKGGMAIAPFGSEKQPGLVKRGCCAAPTPSPTVPVTPAPTASPTHVPTSQPTPGDYPCPANGCAQRLQTRTPNRRRLTCKLSLQSRIPVFCHKSVAALFLARCSWPTRYKPLL